MKNFRLTPKYVLISLAAVFLTFFLHELSHWLAGEALGYSMKMTLNSASLMEGQYRNKSDEQIVSAAGPLFTILQAIVVYFILRRTKNIHLYPFLFAPLYMRILAGALNFINLNDEGRISKYLGLGTFTLSILVCSFLFFLVFKISRQNNYIAKFQIINVVLTMVFSSVLVLADQFLHVRIIN